MDSDWKWARYGLPKNDLETCIPDTRGEDNVWWQPYFEEKLKQSRKDLLFIGDSITDLWTYSEEHKYPGGLTVWRKKYKDIATNFGVTGDKTQTVLWRLTEGRSLDNYYPTHIVLLIGINNLLQDDTPDDTFSGIKTIVEYLRKVRPDSKILVLGIFPCSYEHDAQIREKIKLTNSKIKELADFSDIYFVDIGDTFLNEDGSISRKVLRDGLHLSPLGYAMWNEAMAPYLTAFVSNSNDKIWKS
jgi:beta-glucosidase